MVSIIGTLLLVAHFVMVIPSLGFFLYIKYKHPVDDVRVIAIRYRLHPFTWIRFYGMTLSAVLLFNSLTPFTTNCILNTIIFKLINFNPALATGICAFWLFCMVMASNTASKFLDSSSTSVASSSNSSSDEESHQKSARSVIKNMIEFFPSYKELSNVYLQLKIYAVLWTIFFLIKTIGLIAAVASGQDSSIACSNIGTKYGSQIESFVGLGLLIILCIRLIKVQDAYFMKNEYALMILCTYIPGIIASAAASASDYTRLGNEITFFALDLGTFISFCIPCILTLHQLRKSKGKDESNGIPLKHSHSKDNLEIDPKSYKPETKHKSREDKYKSSMSDAFLKYPSLNSLFKHEKFLKTVSEYAKNWFLIDQLNLLELWVKIRETKWIDEEVDRSYKMYKLYYRGFNNPLDPNHTRIGTYKVMEKYTNIHEEMAKYIKVGENSETGIRIIPNDVFDPCLEEIEAILYQKLFVGFLGSSFYEKFSRSKLLHNVLSAV